MLCDGQDSYRKNADSSTPFLLLPHSPLWPFSVWVVPVTPSSFSQHVRNLAFLVGSTTMTWVSLHLLCHFNQWKYQLLILLLRLRRIILEGSQLVDRSPFVFYVKQIGRNGCHAFWTQSLSYRLRAYTHHTPRSLPSTHRLTIFSILK